MKKKRCLIYAYYDAKGIVHNSTIKLLAEFRKAMEYIFFVSNSTINNLESIQSFVDKIVERPNDGFDVGAYNEIIENATFRNLIYNMDELVFCNNSFWGPFIPLETLFSKMEAKEVDFWGLSFSGKNFAHHLQSYFMVFEKKIINSGFLYEYFQLNITEKKLNYNDVCRKYEIGLSDFLLSKGFTCDAYVNPIRFDSYTNPFGSVKYDNLPILKKKIFSSEFFNENEINSTLLLIQRKYQMDIREITSEAKKIYGISISDNISKTNILVRAEINQNMMLKSWEEIKSYINSKRKIYILGSGYIMHQVVDHFFSGGDYEKLGGIIEIGKINNISKVELNQLLRDYIQCSILICVDDEEVDASFHKLNLKDSFNVWRTQDTYVDNTVSVSDSIMTAMGKYFYYRKPLAIIDDDGYYCGMLSENEMERQYTLAADTTVLAIANVDTEGFTDISKAREYVNSSKNIVPLLDDKGKFIKFVI